MSGILDQVKELVDKLPQDKCPYSAQGIGIVCKETSDCINCIIYLAYLYGGKPGGYNDNRT
jgi:hypothetical protein